MRVHPARLQATGYRFQFPELEPALRHTLGRG
jgi:NAD dependent epimerase/dehydratase family enzyme